MPSYYIQLVISRPKIYLEVVRSRGAVYSVNGQTGNVIIDVGTVNSVNNVEPDVNGNVELEPSDIGAEEQGAAAAAESAANAYTDAALANKADRQNGKISGGGLVIAGNQITVEESEYYIVGAGELTSAEEVFPGIALSAAGMIRYVAFYGKADGTIEKVEGPEGASASIPEGPAGSVLINHSLITDAAIGPGVDLSGYVQKSEKATTGDVINGTGADKWIDAITAQLLRKPRVLTIASSANPTIDVSLYDILYLSALATNITSITIIGTPSNFQPLIIIVKDNGIARSVIHGPSFEAKGTSLFTATVANKVTTSAYFYYPGTLKFGCVGNQQEA